MEAFDGATLRRSVRASDGTATTIALTIDATTGRPSLDVPGATPTPELVAIVRRWLDLDADAPAIDASLARDPALRPLVGARPGLRVPGAIDGFELAVRAVLGQQITVRGARTLAGRIVRVAGSPLAGGPEGVTHAFPTAAQLAAAPLDGLGLTGRRIATLRRLAELVAGGRLDLSADADREATARDLLAVPGVGPWTVQYVRMRALRDPDAFPATDLGIRRGVAALGLPATPAAIRELAERWRPWRAYAAMHLWSMPSASAAGAPASGTGGSG